MQRLTGLLWFLLFPPVIYSAETVLILPFFNLSSAKNIDWIGDSISENVFEALASEGVLTVTPESRDEVLKEMGVRRYARLTRASVMEIAVNLDATRVLFGEIQMDPAPQGSTSRGRLTIQGRILDVRQLRRGPEFVESGPLESLSQLQTRLAWKALRAIEPQSELSETQFIQNHPPVRVDALESYVRGLLAGALEQKLRLFGQAARLEPAFSQPCFQLGKIHYQRKDHRIAAEWLEKVAPSDPHYREALFLMGLSRYAMSDFDRAIASFSKVADSVPLGEVQNNLGAAQLRAGKAEAIDNFLKAIEGDPADPVYYFNAGYYYWRHGRFGDAIKMLNAALDRDPDDETAEMLLERCEAKSGPRAGEPSTERLERLKEHYDESAWQHLKALFGNKPQEQ